MKSKLPIIALLSLAIFLICPLAQADRININLTNTVATGTGPDGTGALGGGTWNRINDLQSAGPNALVKSTGAATTVTATATGAILGASNANGNPVQSESWGAFLAWNFTISGLLSDQVYKLTVYGNRISPGNITVNGLNKSLATPGAAITALPGTENVDYATFIVDATGGGQITVNVSVIASGIQIEGLLNASEKGPQMDCRISKSGVGAGGKGNDLYSIRKSRSQSLTQKTIGRRAKRYYINIENDGDEIDRCYAMAFVKRRKATIKVIERGGAGNVTADALAENHRYDLCKGDTRRFKVVVKPRSRKRSTINVQLCGSPSTLIRNKQDCSTCVLKVVR